jgi:hypothetical protein
MMRLDAGSTTQGAGPAKHRDRLRPLPRITGRPDASSAQSSRLTTGLDEQHATFTERQFDHFLDELRALGFRF